MSIEKNIALINTSVEHILADVEEMNELEMSISAEAFATIQEKVVRIEARVETLDFQYAKQIVGSIEKLKLALTTIKVRPAAASA